MLEQCRFRYTIVAVKGIIRCVVLGNCIVRGMIMSDMAKPLVSVVVPVYNAEPYLRECVDSILGQTLEDIEVICVDDSSTDSSLDILEDYSKRDLRVRVIKQQKSNAGVARNRGLETALGDYIVFIDADDFCEPEMLRELYDAAKSRNADTVVCESRTYSMSSKKYAIPSYMVRSELIPETGDDCFSYADCPDNIFQIFGMAPWNKMFRVEMLKQNDVLAQSLPAANDVLLTASALVCSKRITVIHEKLYTQRKDNPFSITGRLDIDEKWKCGVLSSNALKLFLESRGLYSSVKTSYRKLASHNVIWYLERVRSTDLKIYARYFRYLKQEWLEKLDLLDIEPEDAMSSKEYSIICELQYNDLEDVLINDVARLEKDVWKKSKELDKLKHGKSYKVGKTILKLPRKALRLTRALKAKYADAKIDRAERNARRHASIKICVAAYEAFHYNVTANILKIALEKADYVEAFVFSKALSEMKTALGASFKEIHWHIYPKKNDHLNRTANGERNWRIRASEDIARRRDLSHVILVSPEYHPEYYLPVLEKEDRSWNVIAGVHNLNNVFSNKSKNPLVVELLGKADSYFVLDQLLFDTIRCNQMTSKTVHVLPLVCDSVRTLDSSDSITPTRNRVRFVITGLVEKERKDYEFVVSSLSQASDILPSIELVLLGSASGGYGRHILELVEPLKQQGLSVISFDRFVEDEEFESIMREASCIIGPVRSHTKTQMFDEVYGQTKLSGTVCDMVQYMLPAIVPRDLDMPSDLKGSYLKYANDQEFIKAIRLILDPEKCDELRQAAICNSGKYTLEKVCEAFDLPNL